jgi:hypothetical protein
MSSCQLSGGISYFQVMTQTSVSRDRLVKNISIFQYLLIYLCSFNDAVTLYASGDWMVAMFSN